MKKILIVLGAIIILIIGYVLISPLFITVTVNDELPSDSIMNNSDIMILAQGRFIDADDFHKVSGTAKVIKTQSENILRFENFSTTNGPDLKIYLATDKTASDFVDLGKNKATEGNINYEIPENTDLEKYDTVLIWYRAFGVLFGSAKLN